MSDSGIIYICVGWLIYVNLNVEIEGSNLFLEFQNV